MAPIIHLLSRLWYVITKMTIKALIPVRKGSQRVINKNIKKFANSSLLEIKVKQLLRIPGIDEVCVNSDCDAMLDIANKLGATPIKRVDHFANNTISMNDVWKNLAENISCDDIMYTNVTNPLVTDDVYSSILETWKENSKNKLWRHDSITTVHKVEEYLWDDKGPVNYSADSHPRSQDIRKYFGLNFAVSIIPRSLMIQRKSILGESFMPYFINGIQSMDIDDIDDFKIAEALYREFHNV